MFREILQREEKEARDLHKEKSEGLNNVTTWFPPQRYCAILDTGMIEY
jgi:hypothetical protein